MRPERACAQTHSFGHAEPLGHLFGCEKGRHERSLIAQAPAALLAELALQSPLGDETGHLAV